MTLVFVFRAECFVRFAPIPAIDRIIGELALEWQHQHTRQLTDLFGIAQFEDADGHVCVALVWLGDIGIEQPVPDREVKTVIAIGFAFLYGMVHAVHIRGNEK